MPTNPDVRPTVSAILNDGTLIELLHDRTLATTALAICRPDGSREAVSSFETATASFAPYGPTNNLLTTGCVLLPSAIGDLGDVGDLVVAIQEYLHRYIDLSPVFEELAAYYALYTWVYDAFNDAPGLRVRGDFGSGKSRFLIALGSICYKPFFASGASTVSPIFHILDAFQGVLVLDEADFRFSDASSELVKVLNNGTMRGLPVLRTLTNRHRELNPTAFRVFGPKLVAMRGSFSDPALESRFITEDMGARPMRADIPIHLPQSLGEEAEQLRNRLLAWRFHARFLVGIKPERAMTGASGRMNQMALPLLSIIEDETARRRIGERLRMDEETAREARRTTFEADILRVLMAAFDAGASAVPLTHLSERLAIEHPEESVSPKRIGYLLRIRLHLSTTKSRGVYVVPQSEREKVFVLAQRLGLRDGEKDAA